MLDESGKKGKAEPWEDDGLKKERVQQDNLDEEKKPLDTAGDDKVADEMMGELEALLAGGPSQSSKSKKR
jgi:hypothetical protein